MSHLGYNGVETFFIVYVSDMDCLHLDSQTLVGLRGPRQIKISVHVHYVMLTQRGTRACALVVAL